MNNIYQDEEFKKKVIEKYRDMKEKGIFNDFLCFEKYGGLTVYINDPPLSPAPVYLIKIDLDDVYVGGRP